MKFLEKSSKVGSLLLVFSMVAAVGVRGFAGDTDQPVRLSSVTARGSFGYRRPGASINPVSWSGSASKYTIQMYHRTCYRILLEGSEYLEISISHSSEGMCYSIINAETNVCTHKIYSCSGGELYKMKSVGSISSEMDFAQMSKDADGRWSIVPLSPEGEPLKSWGYTVCARSHRPNANDIVRDGKAVSTVVVSGFDQNIQDVIFLLAGTILK